MLTIIGYLKTIFSCWQEKLQAVLGKSQETAVTLLTSPLGEVEYAVLKRVSGLVGTTLAVFLILCSDLFTSVMLIGIGIVLACLLAKVSGGVTVPVGQ